jgi:hypothetical protein
MSVLDRWEEIAEFFEELLCGKKALFDPNYHDTLLTDDVTLSRSKKYFWAIEFLKELEKSVTDNICQVERFTTLLRANPPPDSRNPRDFSARIRKQYAALVKLEALRVRFAYKREEAVALRDGVSSFTISRKLIRSPNILSSSTLPPSSKVECQQNSGKTSNC